jgi:hypothetical protein
MFVNVEDPAQPLVSSDVQVGDLVRISDRRRQRKQRPGVRDALVGPVVVVEHFEFAQGVQQVVLVPDQGAVEEFNRQVCIHRSMIAFILGIRTPVSTTLIPASDKMTSNMSGNFRPGPGLRTGPGIRRPEGP